MKTKNEIDTDTSAAGPGAAASVLKSAKVGGYGSGKPTRNKSSKKGKKGCAGHKQ